MWTDEPYLFHSRISAMMNLKLLNPRTVLMAVQDAYHRGDAPLAAVEGYIRQILGWREYVHGVYWLHMPQYLEENALEAHEDLPDLYWTGDTDMNCLKHAVGQTLEYGYAHHIQRLMVNGLFSLLFGVKPVEIHKLVSGDLLGCSGVGRASERAGYVAICGRRLYGLKTLCCNRQVHFPDEQLLCGLPL